ncbi:hypothetical protein [Deinococcus radiopugnans]|uniref:Uncharacterized protein n=1 Tax=Deinococcus radiopugnans ATCC 19172 TaxID=585398 RepID=A0A5C4Y772_9DEIO|nr:hypothetical protein [Deinococcus radiopugnans]MBB6016732.1 hypothetical protein [Deinococcus radiopugnans ATCC 19172]TNM70839.1 hypothetical protein FHR04_11785 [Deinococcus radiopugnans ATCC 19172]
MKRVLMAAVGLTGLLASCSVEIGTPIVPVSNLKLVEYTSQYVLANDAVDVNTGQQYSKNTPIICDNLNTRLRVKVDFDGTIDQFGAQLKGRDFGATKTVYSQPLGNIYSGNPSTFEFVVGPNTAPLSVQQKGLSAQDIIVTPINTISVKGASFITVQARSGDGTVSNVAPSVNALPIANCSS